MNLPSSTNSNTNPDTPLPTRFYDVIKTKRDGKELSKQEIDFFVKGVCDGSIPDYQISALLMAICINGMTPQETANLTFAMANSGEKVDLSAIEGKKVDKHSTGGVGDKTSLVIVPIVAACGAKVAKMSGKGLGHTGGTIDKLESIQGYRTDIPRQRFFEIVNQVGASLIGQSGNLAPADKKLYALRDVTATVESLPLIVSSIMSKKIAAGADAILLDVKVGSGSFSKDLDYAEKLAKAMIEIGKKVNRQVTAVLSDMDVPLGNNVGNFLEVQEAVAVLRGNGPKDLTQVCLTLASQMLFLAEKGNIDDCYQQVQLAITNGSALKTFENMVRAHGGNTDFLSLGNNEPKAPYSYKVVSPRSAFVSKMQTDKVGIASLLLGAGRKTKEDAIDYLAGITIHKKTGDFVKIGQPIATLFASDKSLFEQAKNTLLSAYYFADTPPTTNPPIIKILTEKDL